jgi:hypothetical protein
MYRQPDLLEIVTALRAAFGLLGLFGGQRQIGHLVVLIVLVIILLIIHIDLLSPVDNRVLKICACPIRCQLEIRFWQNQRFSLDYLKTFANGCRKGLPSPDRL